MEQNIVVVPELQTYNFLQNSILWLSIITHYLLILHLPKTSAYTVSSLKLRHAMNLGNLRATSVKYSYVAKICPDCIDGKITFFGNQKHINLKISELNQSFHSILEISRPPKISPLKYVHILSIQTI